MKERRIRYFALAFLVAALILGGFFYWDSHNPKFQDLTVELGTGMLTIDDFKTGSAWLPGAKFVTDPASVDLGQTGQKSITLRHGFSEETVQLTVMDTTPPEADVVSHREIPVTGFPEASELVSNIRDASAVSVYYREMPRVPLDYSDISATVVLEDAWGNRTEKMCTFSFRWIRDAVTVELGQEISGELVLYNPVRDISFLDHRAFNRIQACGAGEFSVTASFAGEVQECVLTVQDTTGPELTVRDVQSRYGGPVALEDFVVDVSDHSGIAELRLLSNVHRKPVGSYPVTIEAEDNAGNITRQEATLYVASDFVAPWITGDMSQLTVEKNAPLPDLLEGIRATDNLDGEIPVECDTSAVDMTAGGTYYAAYRATDSSGNVTTRKRRIEVLYDEADTQRMVNEIAATFDDDDIEGMRFYVFYGIGYTEEWGGKDPVWHGFTVKRGNCYVHTLCMKALLDAKEIENQIIWTTDEGHYWLLVKVNNKWKHLDPTPSVIRGPIFMNDAERLATLRDRQWDTTRWPACE